MTANEITAALLIEIPKCWPDRARVWRSNRVKAVVIGRRGRRRMIDAGVDGQADITGIANIEHIVTGGPLGLRLEIEVKSGKDTLSEAQMNFRGMIRSLGGIYIVARDVENTLKDLAVWMDL